MKFTTLLLVTVLAAALDCVQVATSDSVPDSAPPTDNENSADHEYSEEFSDLPDELKFLKLFLVKGIAAAKNGASKAKTGMQTGAEGGKKVYEDANEFIKGLKERFGKSRLLSKQ
ncbi:hypothetical protein H1C71_013108 [Ictidomys tridecemlineatus]|nr:hypothetical protein H1C71_013108 [Ictidomys tridecemlineatus]